MLQPVAALFLLGVAINNGITGAHPTSPTFSEENQRDVAKRNKVRRLAVFLVACWYLLRKALGFADEKCSHPE